MRMQVEAVHLTIGRVLIGCTSVREPLDDLVGFRYQQGRVGEVLALEQAVGLRTTPLDLVGQHIGWKEVDVGDRPCPGPGRADARCIADVGSSNATVRLHARTVPSPAPLVTTTLAPAITDGSCAILPPVGAAARDQQDDTALCRAGFLNSALFAHAAPETIDQLVSASRIRTLERNAVLLLDGSVPTSLYVVVSGLLRVFVTSFDGTEPTLSIMFPGDNVGELGVLHNTPRSASVGALRPTAVVEVPGRAFREAYDSDGAISRVIVEQLANRLRQTSSRLCDLTLLDLGARLAKFLLHDMVEVMNGVPFVDLAITQAELGQLIGGARQSINQLLAAMEAEGVVAVRGRRIDLLDVARLRRRAEMAA
jgi:CRP-like cAMP-binding protein